MENSLKQEFTRRLSQCNNGEMIVIMYDIVFAYMDEARASYAVNSYDGYKAAVKKSQGVGPDDMGRVIGKQGRIAKAIRSVVKAASSKDNTIVDVEIV